MAFRALASKVPGRAVMAGIADIVAGVVEGVICPALGVVAIVAGSRPVPAGCIVTLCADCVAGVIEINSKPGNGIVAARALPEVMCLRGGMACAAVTGAGVVTGGIPPTVHVVTGVAVIAVVVIRLIAGMAVDAVQVAQVVECVFAPIRCFVACRAEP